VSAFSFDPIRLEVYKNLIAAIADEMGVVLQKASYSPNIKERRDFSCAIFNLRGEMIAQAAHIPVHLGAMPMSVAAALEEFGMDSPEKSALEPGDVIILNDPFRGGTHLPDITMITPVFIIGASQGGSTVSGPGLTGSPPHLDNLFGFVANRAHHADVGGFAAGSMSIAREVYQEGLIIPPLKLFRGGRINQDVMNLILANVRTPKERMGDILAQVAANQRGVTRLQEIINRNGLEEVSLYMDELMAYTERMTRSLIKKLPNGTYQFTDYLDDDGLSEERIPISVKITIQEDEATVDFSGSAAQVQGSLNAVLAITLSSVYYVFRCLINLDVPNNSGCLAPIHVIAPPGTVVNAHIPAPVAGGNVETSQRIVDVLLGALSKAAPELVPAASQGTMNNLTIGGITQDGSLFTYYETIGGGMGARPHSHGPSAIHSHMTNTLNTPIEALEYAYPLQVLRYEIRQKTGGEGRYRGGDGIRRDVKVLVDAQVSLLTERRRGAPYGLAGGSSGKKGKNQLISGDHQQSLPGKGTFYLEAGQVISIQTPGGGGFGEKD
jgi:N-methylhydantoinase B